MRSVETKKIHLGCGEKKLTGFINIDARKTECTDLVCDINNLPFDDNSIDLIYMCHSLEHIPLYSIQPTLLKLYKVLRKGGRLFISVPDFNVLSSLYLSGKVPLTSIVRAIHGGQEYPENTHYMSYDRNLLSSILSSSGFSLIGLYNPDEFLPKGFTDTSTYQIGGKRISLNLCASK